MEQIIADIAAQRPHGSTVILCLSTGAEFPAACEPMARRPMPRIGIGFDQGFVGELERALAENPAVEDGAIMVGRDSSTETYRIVGWAFRLFAPSALVKGPPNRGSAFNSCLAMSNVPTVDCVYLISDSGSFSFRHGRVTGPLFRGRHKAARRTVGRIAYYIRRCLSRRKDGERIGRLAPS
jgi:hypothetical protein